MENECITSNHSKACLYWLPFISCCPADRPGGTENRDKEYKETPTYEQLIDNIKEQKEYAIKDSARIYLGQSLLYADSARIADTDITMER